VSKNQTEEQAMLLFDCILILKAYDLAQDLKYFEKQQIKLLDLQNWLDGMKSKSIRI
jgi:hypothetical protein